MWNMNPLLQKKNRNVGIITVREKNFSTRPLCNQCFVKCLKSRNPQEEEEEEKKIWQKIKVIFYHNHTSVSTTASQEEIHIGHIEHC